MDRRFRTKLCVWLMVLGLGNFLAYAVGYAVIGGDAHNGSIRDGHYFVRGHFIHYPRGAEQEVSRETWIYSYIHSISIWPSIATVLLAMLMLARPHILATYQQGMVKGSTLVTVISTLIVFVTGVIMINFSVEFVRTLTQ